MTALGMQEQRFLQRPDEEPGFLAAWIAACERRYRRLDDEALLKDLEGLDRATERVRAFLKTKARELYPVAKAGDVRAFHCALVGSRPAEEAP
jgi:hypothetical protein